MAVKNRVFAIPLTSTSSASVSGTYSVINSGGLPFACFLIRINNASNQSVTISYDGTNDHEFLASNGVLQLDLQANSLPSNFVALMAAGTKVYVKGTGGTGAIYLSGYYLD